MPLSQPEGFLALPPGAQGRPVLVLHAWWGLNDTFKNFCTRLAKEGFVVFAPDLYHGKVAATIPEAETLGKALDNNFPQAKAEIAQAVEFLDERAGPGDASMAVVAFSLGGYYALDLAAADPAHIRSVVLFYGAGDADYSSARASYLGHFASNDVYEAKSTIENLEAALKKAGRSVNFYWYDNTEHWFFEPDRTKEYNHTAADLAWERTLEFLNRPT